jgi:hypothetical protein
MPGRNGSLLPRRLDDQQQLPNRQRMGHNGDENYEAGTCPRRLGPAPRLLQGDEPALSVHDRRPMTRPPLSSGADGLDWASVESRRECHPKAGR